MAGKRGTWTPLQVFSFLTSWACLRQIWDLNSIVLLKACAFPTPPWFSLTKKTFVRTNSWFNVMETMSGICANCKGTIWSDLLNLGYWRPEKPFIVEVNLCSLTDTAEGLTTIFPNLPGMASCTIKAQQWKKKIPDSLAARVCVFQIPQKRMHNVWQQVGRRSHTQQQLHVWDVRSYRKTPWQRHLVLQVAPVLEVLVHSP